MKATYASIFVSVFFSSLLAATETATNDTGGATYLSAAELASKVTQIPSGTAYTVPSSPGYTVLMIQRDKTGDAEVHMAINDTIILQHGKGTFRVGGRIKGNHEVQPTEWRGGEISGAHDYPMSAGDLLLIPAGVPHQAVVTSGAFTYLAIKTPKQSATAH
jgi:mannose-6-phosphate isomerase-like protein (cupin superfamily)